MTANLHKIAQMKARYWCEVEGHLWAWGACTRCDLVSRPGLSRWVTITADMSAWQSRLRSGL